MINRRMNSVVLFVVLTLIGWKTTSATGADWSHWLGPSGDSISPNTVFLRI